MNDNELGMMGGEVECFPEAEAGATSVEDPRVVAAVEEFAARLRAGERPPRQALLDRFPRLAQALAECLDGLEFVWAACPELEGGLGREAGGLPLGDYRIVREIGCGGMGVVYEAEQLSLGRRVALKVLPFAATLNPRHLQRFVNEARAAATLEHPHIVPIYGVGCERGVHYYAMKFIEGQSLAQLLASLRPVDSAKKPGETGPSGPVLSPTGDPKKERQDKTEGPCPGPAVRVETPPPGDTVGSGSRRPKDRAFFRQVAEWGIQAAEAMEHAHSLGIVHRDIKPANLLIDVQGHLWVTDFGLARVAADASLTVSGTVVGTLRYMSPEQALAKHGLVDHHTDIYALGATLYELLTLEPAVSGKDREETLHRIESEDPVPPRKRNRAIPVDLETIVLKAMAREPGQRYGTAQALADDLRRWLEDKPIVARRPRWRKRLGYWARRHQRSVSAALALLVTGLLLSVSGLVWWFHQRAARLGAEAALVGGIQEDLAQLTAAIDEDRLPEAWRNLERAEGRLSQGGLDWLQREVGQQRRDLDMIARLEEARLARSSWDETTRTFDFQGGDRSYAAAFSWFGLEISGNDPEGVATQIRGSRIKTVLVSALDDWASVREKIQPGSGSNLTAIATRADNNTWRQGVREAWKRKDFTTLEKSGAEEGIRDQPAANICLLAGYLERNPTSQAVREKVMRQAQLRYPNDFWVNLSLANLLTEKVWGKAPKEPYYFWERSPTPLVDAKNEGHQTLLAEAAGYLRVAVALRPGSLGVNINLGHTLRRWGKSAEAIEVLQQTVKNHPNSGHVHYNLAFALQKMGKNLEAISSFHQALRLNSDDSEIHHQMAHALYSLGKKAEAEEALQRAIKLQPTKSELQLCLFIMLNEQGKFPETISALPRVLPLISDDANYSQYLNIFNNLIRELATSTKPKVRDPPTAVRLAKKAVELHPKHGPFLTTLGLALFQNGDPKGAIQILNPLAERDLGTSHIVLFTLALAHGQLGDKARARQWYEKAVDWTNVNLPRNKEVNRLRMEAARILGISEEEKESLSRAEHAENCLRQGVDHLKEGNCAEALRVFDEAFQGGSLKPSFLHWVSGFIPTLFSRTTKLPGMVYASEMPWVKSTCGWKDLLGWGPSEADRDFGREGEAYPVDCLAGFPCSKWIWNQSFNDGRPADVVLDISERRFRTLKTLVGVGKEGGTVQFQILVDGKVRQETPVLHWGAIQPMNVDVGGGKEVILRVLNGGDDAGCDCAYWGWPRFIEEGAEDPLEIPRAHFRSEPETSGALVLTLVYLKWDQREKAQRWFDQAVQWLETNPPSNPHLRGFCGKIAHRLGVPEPLPAPKEIGAQLPGTEGIDSRLGSKSAIPWFGYVVRQRPAKSIPEIASYTNLVVDHGWPNYGDELIRAARKAGLKVALAFLADPEKGLFLKEGFALARQNRDVVVAVFWDDPYETGAMPVDLSYFGRQLKKEAPGVQFWCLFTDLEKFKAFSAPKEIDTMMIDLCFFSDPNNLGAQSKAMVAISPGKAQGRPVLLHWSSWEDNPPGLVSRVVPGVFRYCRQLIQEKGFRGLIMDNYGSEPASQALRYNPFQYSAMVGLQTRPDLVKEIKEVAQDLGIKK